jgi:hypothetical protein
VDARQAQEQLDAARRASTGGAIPRLSWWTSISVGLLVAGAVTLAGWASSTVWWHLVELVAAVGLGAAAVSTVRSARRRRGVRGLRGRAREEWTATLVSALAFFVVALSATPEGRWIYVGLGVVGGALTAVLLHRRGS